MSIQTSTGTESQRYSFYNDYLDGWHRFRIEIDDNRRASFFIDNELVWQTVGSLTLDYNDNPILLGNRSSTYGKTYHDNIRVSRYLSDSFDLSYTGPDFSLSSNTGIVNGTVSVTSSPYWPNNSYNIRDYAVGNVDDDPEAEIVFIANHSPYYPGQVYVVNLDGSEVGRYWNPGHLYSILLHDSDNDGVEEIYIGATNNDYLSNGTNVPAIFALDARTMDGEAPPRRGGIGSGNELWYEVMDNISAGIQVLNISGGEITGNTQRDGSGTSYNVVLP